MKTEPTSKRAVNQTDIYSEIRNRLKVDQPGRILSSLAGELEDIMPKESDDDRYRIRSMDRLLRGAAGMLDLILAKPMGRRTPDARKNKSK